MHKKEVARLKQAYEIYGKTSTYQKIWSGKGAQYIHYQRQRKIKLILKKFGILQKLSTKKTLEIGCGGGGVLEEYRHFRIDPHLLYGIDLRMDSLRRGGENFSLFHFIHADASYLPFNNHSFDLGISYTVFSSLFDTQMKKNIGRELLRVLKPEGIILWYDMRYPNPFNPNTTCEKKGMIQSYFPECSIECFSMTLIPHIARILAPVSWRLCSILEKIPFLRSHYFAIIRKKV